MAHGQTIGYVRVSSLDQNSARQLDGIALDQVFTDKLSGKDTNRPQLQAAIKHLRGGDVLVIHSMDRLARSLDDLRKIVLDLTGRGVKVQFVKEGITFTGENDKMANLLLSLMGAFAEFERAIIKERQMEGIAIAKRNGVYKGRQPALNPARVADLRVLVTAGKNTKAELARQFGISRAALYVYLKSTIPEKA